MNITEAATRSYNFSEILAEGEILLIVPPFSHYAYGSLACHLLQALARQSGHSTSVLYANLLLANILGEEGYKAVSLDYHQLIGERLYTRAAYGGEPFGDSEFRYESTDPVSDLNSWGIVTHQPQFQFSWEQAAELEAVLPMWVENVAKAIVDRGFKFVGCTTAFQQTTSSIALLNAVKRLDPSITTLIGGSNCEGEMAEGIASLQGSVDYIFSGESDGVFVPLIEQVMAGNPPAEKIVKGEPCQDLDALPTPTYTEFFDQLKTNLPEVVNTDRVWVSYETSRGCWWGAKSHCTFCGLNGTGMAFREKSSDRVIEELSLLVQESGSNNVMTTDNIMSNKYFDDLLPRLATEIPDLKIHYEIKANLTFDKVSALDKAGVRKIQPGIEALSSDLLKRMGKGIRASKNIELLRYCRMFSIDARWNLLCHFPGDLESDYRQTLELVPLLTHIEPPTGIFPLSIDRFSPYHYSPEEYGITNVRPASMYDGVLPPGADVDKIAYHFEADYEAASRSNEELIEEISAAIRKWINRWEMGVAARPKLLVQPLSEDNFIVIDTRDLDQTEQIAVVSREQARAMLMADRDTPKHLKEWAVGQNYAIALENQFVPLALCAPEVFVDLRSSDDRQQQPDRIEMVEV